MAKKNNKSNKKSKKTPKVRTSTSLTANSPGMGAFRSTRSLLPAARYISAVKNPFASAAVGVKIPDFDSNPSFTVASKDLYSITTDASGQAAWMMMFGHPSQRDIKSTSITAGAANFSTTPTTDAWAEYPTALDVTACVGCRSVAGGFRIQSMMSPAGTNAAAGRLIIAPVAPTVAARLAGSGTVNEAQLRKFTGARVVPLPALTTSGKPVRGITGPLDPTAMTYFSPATSLGYSLNDSPANVAFICLVLGAPASATILEVEQVNHWECLPNLNYAAMATTGIASDMSVIQQAFNWFQSIDLVNFADTAYDAMSYVNRNLHSSYPRLLD